MNIMANGIYTHEEIASQPVVWKAVLDNILSQAETYHRQLSGLAERPFVVSGCGSTYYLALHAVSLLRHIGIDALALPASELAFFPMQHLPKQFVFLAISRSGTTSETLWAIKAYRRFMPLDGKIINITCVPDTPMVQASDVIFLAHQAQEMSIAQTRSFTSMALMVQILAGILSNNHQYLESLHTLPAILDHILARYSPAIEKLATNIEIDRFFFLGSGAFYGIACEAMLKTKEMSCSWAESYHSLEFRHGPMSVITPSSLVIGLISDSAAAEEIRVLNEMKEMGARTLAICEERGALDLNGIDYIIELCSGLDEWQRPILCLPPLQQLAFYRSLAKGLNPDAPLNLSQVVRLEYL